MHVEFRGDTVSENVAALIEELFANPVGEPVSRWSGVFVYNAHGCDSADDRRVLWEWLRSRAFCLRIVNWALPPVCYERAPHNEDEETDDEHEEGEAATHFDTSRIAVSYGLDRDVHFVARGGQQDAFRVNVSDYGDLPDWHGSHGGTAFCEKDGVIYFCFDLLHEANGVADTLTFIMHEWFGVELLGGTPIPSEKIVETVNRLFIALRRGDHDNLASILAQNEERLRNTVRDYMGQVRNYVSQIETARRQLANWDETKMAHIIEEDKAAFLKMPAVKLISVSDSEAVFEVHDQNFMGIALPPFRFRYMVKYRNDRQQIVCSTQLYHPHISGDGFVCFGTAESTAQVVMLRGQLNELIFMLMYLLRSFSQEGAPYNNVSTFMQRLITSRPDSAKRVAALWNAVYLKGYPSQITPTKTIVHQWEEGELPPRDFLNERGDFITREDALEIVQNWEKETGLNAEKEANLE